MRSTVKHEPFLAHVYFSNETVSETALSTGPIKMFRLEHETIDVCQRNVARFGHSECMFDQLTTFFRVLDAWCHCDFRQGCLEIFYLGRVVAVIPIEYLWKVGHISTVDIEPCNFILK